MTPRLKHTPGPWKTRVPIIPITKLAADDRMVLAHAFDGSEKAIVDRVRGGTPEQANANALLIAAAPSMYQELELAADTFRDFHNVLLAIGKDVMSAAAGVAERHIRECLAEIADAGLTNGPRRPPGVR